MTLRGMNYSISINKLRYVGYKTGLGVIEEHYMSCGVNLLDEKKSGNSFFYENNNTGGRRARTPRSHA